ncbi:TIGR00282 family metallophosphoesterase [Candidatus Sumerlaeota bacterium]|nr:TIGR00282 family metallophosphoesterase [Candidatus Sumerlaeota bacterium]
MRILFIGDVVGRPGRELVAALLPKFRKEKGIDFVLANGENAAGGKGITPEVADDLFRAGVDVLTGGNHIWQNKQVFHIIETESRLLRPANYPVDPDVPGRGSGLYEVCGSDAKIGVVNLLGRVFMAPVDCPFRVGRELVDRLRQVTPLIVVDIHAEATSEKNAMAWHLDGLVTAVIGTHTHVATADERISDAGTAAITDVGMTGAHDGVIGVRRDIILHAFLTQLPVRHELAKRDLHLRGVLIDADPATGRASAIERVSLRSESA